MNSTNLYSFQNITFKCYSTSQSKSNHSNKLLLTIKISVSLYPTINVLVQVFQSRTRYTKVRQIKHASLQQLNFLLPLVVSINVYYKFSYHVDREHDIILRWPSWPLSSKRVKKCRDTLRKKQIYSIPCQKCSLTDNLRIITPQELLSAEKETLSSWIDVQYEVSDFSSIIGYRRMHPFERALKNQSVHRNFMIGYQNIRYGIRKLASKSVNTI